MIDLIDRVKLLRKIESAIRYEVLEEYFLKKEDVIKLIEDAPRETDTTVQKICDKCSHREVCIVHLKSIPEHLLKLSSCHFFTEAKHE